MYTDELDNISYEDFIKTLNVLTIIKSPIITMETPSFIADGFSKLEEKEERITEILLNARTYSHFRKLSSDMIDVETSAENIRKGIMAYMWGAVIIVRKVIPENTAILLSESRKAVILQFEKIEEKNLISKLMNLYNETIKELNEITKKQKQIKNILYKLTLKEEPFIESK